MLASLCLALQMRLSPDPVGRPILKWAHSTVRAAFATPFPSRQTCQPYSFESNRSENRKAKVAFSPDFQFPHHHGRFCRHLAPFRHNLVCFQKSFSHAVPREVVTNTFQRLSIHQALAEKRMP